MVCRSSQFYQSSTISSYYRWSKESLVIVWGLKMEQLNSKTILGSEVSHGVNYWRRTSMPHLYPKMLWAAMTTDNKFLKPVRMKISNKTYFFWGRKMSSSSLQDINTSAEKCRLHLHLPSWGTRKLQQQRWQNTRRKPMARTSNRKRVIGISQNLIIFLKCDYDTLK